MAEQKVHDHSRQSRNHLPPFLRTVSASSDMSFHYKFDENRHGNGSADLIRRLSRSSQHADRDVHRPAMDERLKL
jgi:hypothetical protein